MEFRRSLRVTGVARESGMGSSLALSCNIRMFVIELDYGYRYLLEVYSELSSICFLSLLRYYSMLALHDRPVLEMVSDGGRSMYLPAEWGPQTRETTLLGDSATTTRRAGLGCAQRGSLEDREDL